MKVFTIKWYTRGYAFEPESGTLGTFSNIEAANALVEKSNKREINPNPDLQRIIEDRDVVYYVEECEVFDTLQEYDNYDAQVSNS